MRNLKKWEDIERSFNFTPEEDAEMEKELNCVREEIRLKKKTATL